MNIRTKQPDSHNLRTLAFAMAVALGSALAGPRGSPPLTFTAHACCFGIFVWLVGFAEVPSLLISLPRA